MAEPRFEDKIIMWGQVRVDDQLLIEGNGRKPSQMVIVLGVDSANDTQVKVWYQLDSGGKRMQYRDAGDLCAVKRPVAGWVTE